tara:strand:- start:332 stop:868 length:537 start_codon:yes stop_codon:yes gene_type:complete
MGSLRNQMLIAMPHMSDLIFSKSVIYICEHDRDGAMGIIINKQLHSSDIKAIIKQPYSFGSSSKSSLKSIYFGGPVSLEKEIIIYSTSAYSHQKISILKGKSELNELKVKKDIQYKIMLGHSGWGAGQLEKEIKNGDWLIQNTSSDFAFNIPSNQMWKKAVQQTGVDLSSPIDPIGYT